MQIVENLLQTGVKALCLTPSGSRGVVPAWSGESRQHPVVIVDAARQGCGRRSGREDRQLHRSDNYVGGRIAAKFIVEKTGGKANVACSRHPGHGPRLTAAFRTASSSPESHRRVARQLGARQGFNVFQNMLQAHADIGRCSRAAT
jgi:ABC-type sugar transport system substrate-binding protein